MGRSIEDILATSGIEVSDEELEHAGVKGMRWGVRKRKKAEAAAAEAAKPKVKDMDDAELKARINRLKLEKEYATLTAPQISEGRKIVGKILKDVGEQQAKNFLNGEIGKLMAVDNKADKLTGAGKMAAKLAKSAKGKPVQKQVYQLTSLR